MAGGSRSKCIERTPYLRLWVQIGWIGWDWQLHWPGFHGNNPSRYTPQSAERGHSALTSTKWLWLHTRREEIHYWQCVIWTYLALPTITLCAQGCMISMKEPWSKKPLCQEPFGAGYTERKRDWCDRECNKKQKKKTKQGNKRENWVHSFHGASKSLVLFLLQSEVVYFFPQNL